MNCVVTDFKKKWFGFLWLCVDVFCLEDVVVRLSLTRSNKSPVRDEFAATTDLHLCYLIILFKRFIYAKLCFIFSPFCSTATYKLTWHLAHRIAWCGFVCVDSCVCVCVISFFKSKRVAHRSTPPSNMDQTQVTLEVPVLASWLIHPHNDWAFISL